MADEPNNSFNDFEGFEPTLDRSHEVDAGFDEPSVNPSETARSSTSETEKMPFSFNTFEEWAKGHINKKIPSIFKKKCPYCFGSVNFLDVKRQVSKTGTHVSLKAGHNIEHDTWIHYCTHCQQNLPFDFFKANSKNIVIIGLKNTGKSTYILQLSNLLLQSNTSMSNIGIHACIENEEGREVLEGYNMSLYKHAKPIKATETAEKPILLRFSKKGESNNVTFITILDNQGELFTKKDEILAKHQFLNHADGFVFLIDPLEMELVRELIIKDKKLNRNINITPKDPNSFQAGNYDVIKIMHNIFVAKKLIKANKKISVPVAFVVSKGDILEELYGVNIPPDRENLFEDVNDALEEIELFSDEFKEILEEIDSRLLAIIDDCCQNYSIMPMSSLGFTPVNDRQNEKESEVGRIDVDKMNPKGVLLPFIWLFKELKIIK